MASSALVQTRIDADVKQRAAAVLENMGLTVSDAVRILLTLYGERGRLPARTRHEQRRPRRLVPFEGSTGARGHAT